MESSFIVRHEAELTNKVSAMLDHISSQSAKVLFTINFASSDNDSNKLDSIDISDWVSLKIATLLKITRSSDIIKSASNIYTLYNLLSFISVDIKSNIDKLLRKHNAICDTLINQYMDDGNINALMDSLLALYLNEKLKTRKSSVFVRFIKLFRYDNESLLKISSYFGSDGKDNIINDYTINHKLYLQTLYHYYFEYYKRSNSASEYTCSLLEILTQNKDNIFDIMFNSIKEVDSDIYYKFNPTMPIDHLIDDLNNLKDIFAPILLLDVQNAFTSAISEKSESKEIFYNIFKSGFDYVRSKEGKVINKLNIDKMFRRWQRYLEVFDMHQKGLSWGQIVLEMGKNPIFEKLPKTAADARNDFKQAEILIQSAINLNFPY